MALRLLIGLHILAGLAGATAILAAKRPGRHPRCRACLRFSRNTPANMPLSLLVLTSRTLPAESSVRRADDRTGSVVMVEATGGDTTVCRAAAVSRIFAEGSAEPTTHGDYSAWAPAGA